MTTAQASKKISSTLQNFRSSDIIHHTSHYYAVMYKYDGKHQEPVLVSGTSIQVAKDTFWNMVLDYLISDKSNVIADEVGKYEMTDIQLFG